MGPQHVPHICRGGFNIRNKKTHQRNFVVEEKGGTENWESVQAV